jgi:hypothetical protein
MTMDVQLDLTAEEHDAVLTTVLTIDWISSPVWHAVFRKWAESAGESEGLWLADLYDIGTRVDYLKDGAPSDLWAQWLLYLPTDGGVPGTAMVDIERLARGEDIERGVDDLLNEMSRFMIDTVQNGLVHNYVYGPFSTAIGEYKAAWGAGGNGGGGGGGDGHRDDDDGHYGLSALKDDDDGHYGLSALKDDDDDPQNQYDLYPGTPEQHVPIEELVQFDVAQAENQRALKEAQEPGTRVPFWQVGSHVLLGQGHELEYYQHLLDRGAVSGWATVVSRGNVLRRDPGLVQVVGSNDPESFAWTIGQFSNKRLEFV